MAVEQATDAPIIHGIQPTTGLDLKSRNKAENWKAYKQRWENYIIVTQLDKQPEEYRFALFLYCIGQEAVKVYDSFDLAPEDKRKLVKIIDKFDNYAIGQVNETYEIYNFNSRAKQDGETIDEYVAKLRTLAQTCGFCVCLHDSLIRDRMVLGVADASTWKRLLQHSKLNLQESIEICRNFEATNSLIRQMGEQNKLDEVNKVQSTKSRTKGGGARNKANYGDSNKTQHHTKRVDIVVESTSLDANRVQRGVRRVIRLESGIISQSNAATQERQYEPSERSRLELLLRVHR